MSPFSVLPRHLAQEAHWYVFFTTSFSVRKKNNIYHHYHKIILNWRNDLRENELFFVKIIRNY